MKIILLTILLLQLVFLGNSSLIPHDGELVPSEPPLFRMDLNVDPEHRWDHIIPTFKERILTFLDMIYSGVPIPDSTFKLFGTLINKYYKYEEYVDEIKGIAKQLDVMWEKVFIANFFYEGSTFPMCTSVLAKNFDNKILHGRNLDFPWQEYLSKMVARVQVYKGDKFIGVWDQIIGGVLVLSGYNPDLLSVTVDTRFYQGTIPEILDNILIKQYFPAAFLTRYVLEQEFTYEEGTSVLLNTDTTSSIYYIVGGTTDGMIIEKDDVGYNDYHNFSETNPEDWFLVQTNYDWNKDPQSDDRKTPTVERLNKIGKQNIDEENLFEVMMQYPTLNKSTIYSLVFSPEYGYDDISLWYGNVDSKDTNKAYQTFDKELQKELIRFSELVQYATSEEFYNRIVEHFEPIY